MKGRTAINLAVLTMLMAGSACRKHPKRQEAGPPPFPIQGVFRVIGPMQKERARVDAVPLPDGCILMLDAGAERIYPESTSTGTVELFDPRTEAFLELPPLSSRRIAMAVARAGKEQVVLAGGFDLDADRPVDTIELFNTSNRSSHRPAVRLVHARMDAQAVALPDGKVLILGGAGVDRKAVTEVELFDPVAVRCSVVAKLNQPREEGFTATALEDGRVLVTGGIGPAGYGMADAELYRPDKQRFDSLPPMGVGRTHHMAVRLRDGSVLLAGGKRAVGAENVPDRSAERFLPKDNRFASTGTLLNDDRLQGSATLLRDGRVLILGGWVGHDFCDRTEWYDPVSGIFSAGPILHTRRGKSRGVPLADGRVLVIGDRRSEAELLE